MKLLEVLLEFLKITLGFVSLYAQREVKSDCWYIGLNGSYIKVEDYQWERDEEGDVVLNINRYQ